MAVCMDCGWEWPEGCAWSTDAPNNEEHMNAAELDAVVITPTAELVEALCGTSRRGCALSTLSGTRNSVTLLIQDATAKVTPPKYVLPPGDYTAHVCMHMEQHDRAHAATCYVGMLCRALGRARGAPTEPAYRQAHSLIYWIYYAASMRGMLNVPTPPVGTYTVPLPQDLPHTWLTDAFELHNACMEYRHPMCEAHQTFLAHYHLTK
ncbi:ORF7 [Ranid herpesvirus 1]|uniref:ORF7 n=1 Tax=Ranid herpesvirus 1 TaxID=85655 RepID=Q14VV1_9VIRU|nr:ORF7 [Ranid herpesvirus 1]ABG25812.1 ORF7 [Ranid herpesvirus 1]